MGYFLVSPPETRWNRHSNLGDPTDHFTPPFEGPVIGLKHKPKIDIIINPLNAGKTEATLLDLRHRWLNAFFLQLEVINPKIPHDVVVEWVINHLPKTASSLADSIVSAIPEKLAFRLADAWEAK